MLASNVVSFPVVILLVSSTAMTVLCSIYGIMSFKRNAKGNQVFRFVARTLHNDDEYPEPML